MPLGPLFAYSLAPVLAVALLLFFTALLRGRNARGLTMFCLAVAAWTGALSLVCLDATAPLGRRLAAIGAFITAGYLHAAWDLTKQRSYGLVWFAYAVALALTLLGVAQPGALYDPGTLARGPYFWLAMALAVGSSTVPLGVLWFAWRTAEGDRRAVLQSLLIAGTLTYIGGMGNALLLSHGIALPFGLYLVLGGLLVLANVIRAHEPAGNRRLLERSLLYSAIAAFLSAGFLFGLLSLTVGGGTIVTQYRLGALFLLFLAALATEPLRQQIQEWLGRRLLRDRAHATDLAQALATQEARADQAERLAELGQLVSAVAHEVRNPLGVLAAHLKMLERKGVDPDTTVAMREQIDRAGRFVEDLLRYGRPRPLEVRRIDLAALVQLAHSTARQGLGPLAPEATLRFEGPNPLPIEADQAQLSQVFVVLFENALLALGEAPRRELLVRLASAGGRAHVALEDSGPGVPESLLARLFQPFVSGRSRSSPRPGTGLGLATARTIVERHAGAISVRRSSLGGACFEVELPLAQPVLAAATAAPPEEVSA